MKDRVRFYCGNANCECRYQEGWREAEYGACEATSAKSTIGEMRQSFEPLLSDLPDATPATWSFSYTLMDVEQEPPQEPSNDNIVNMPNRPARTARVRD